MIELRGVTKSYNGTIKAVDQLNLQDPRSGIFGFLGPNGAGKAQETTSNSSSKRRQVDETALRIGLKARPAWLAIAAKEW